MTAYVTAYVTVYVTVYVKYFTPQSDAEKQSRLGLQNMTETLEAELVSVEKRGSGYQYRSKRAAPTSIDWIARGTQPAVKNQGTHIVR